MKPLSLRGWIAGLLAFLAIVVPWPIALFVHYHLFPIEKLIGEYTIGRYTGVIENQSGPIWYYLPVIILGFFPWIAFLPMAIVYGLRPASRRRCANAAARAVGASRLRLDRDAIALLQLCAHETSKLRGARVSGARADHRALFRCRRAQGRDALGSHFRRDGAGDDRGARFRDPRSSRATTVSRPRSQMRFRRCSAMAIAIFAGSLLTALLVARPKTARLRTVRARARGARCD